SLKLDFRTVEPTLHQAEAGARPHEAATVQTSDNTLRYEGLPILPLPDYTEDVDEGDTLPLKKGRAGEPTRFGYFGQALGGGQLNDLAEWFDEELDLQKPLELRDELAVDAYSKRGVGLGPALDWKAPGLIEGDLGGYWIHDHASVDESVPFPI